MSKHSLVFAFPTKLVLAILAVLFAIWFLPIPQVLSQQMQEVFIRNFPETQQVIGNISIQEPIPSTKTEHYTEVVSPVARHEIVHLIDGGVIETEGFVTVTATVYGWMKSGTYQPGEIGVLLIPDEEVFERALDDGGEILLPIEVKAPVNQEGSGYFAAQDTFAIGFDRYRILFYNSSTKSAETNLRVYLGQ